MIETKAKKIINQFSKAINVTTRSFELLSPSIHFKHSFSRTSSKFSRPVRQSEKVITNFTFPYSAMQRKLVEEGFE